MTVTVGAATTTLGLFLNFDDLTANAATTKDCSTYNAVVTVPVGIVGDTNGLKNTTSMSIATAGPAISATSMYFICILNNIVATAFNTLNGALAITVYVKLQPTCGDTIIVSNKNAQSGTYGFQLEYINNVIQLWGSGGDFCATKTVLINDNNWHRITAVANGTYCYIFIDEVPVTSDNSITAIVGSTDPLVIGSGLTGEIDQLAIYVNFMLAYQVEGLVDTMPSCNSPVSTTGNWIKRILM